MPEQPQSQDFPNDEFFALLSRDIDAKFPETEPIRIDRDGWDMLHEIVDNLMSQNLSKLAMIATITDILGDEPLERDEARAIAEFNVKMRTLVAVHKAVASVCSRIAKGQDVDLIAVPF